MPIISIAKVEEALKHVTPQDRLYVDLDETLIRVEPDASPLFEAAMKTALEANGVDGVSARAATCELWQGMQSDCVVDAVEPSSTYPVLQALKAQGVEVVGLTARSPALVDETVGQLAKSKLASLFDAGSFGELAPSAPGDTRPPLTHATGVIYCTGSRKPVAVCAYEARRPSQGRLVLIDDLKSHLEAVEKACASAGRSFLGLHYTYLASQQYELPRLGVCLASVLSTARGRNYVRESLRHLEATTSSSVRQVAPTPLEGGAPTLAFGAFLAGAACMLLLVRMQRPT